MRNYLLKKTSPPLESVGREPNATRKNHIWSRANRASSYVARDVYMTPLPFHDDSSKNPGWLDRNNCNFVMN